MSRYPWRDTSSDISGGQPPQWETPQGAQKKADDALTEAKEYTDQQNVDFNAHIADTTIHVTPVDKANWNSKAPGVHTHANATPTTPGFMSAEDKTKLNGVEAEANHYVHPATHPPAIIAQDGLNRFVSDTEKATWNGKADTTEATTTSKGLMSPADKLKLNGIEAEAEVNQNTFAQVNNILASDPSDALSVVGGLGITITTNPTNKELTVTATGDAAPGAHGTTHTEYGADPIPSATVTEGGLMSSADKSLQLAHTQELDGLNERFNTPERSAITLQPGIHVVQADQDSAFKLTGLQGRTVLNYQSQVGIYGVLNPYVIRYGANLLPPFYDGWQNTPRNDATGKGTVISPYNYSVVANAEESWIGSPLVPAIPGVTYTFSAEHIGQIMLGFTDKNQVSVGNNPGGYSTDQSVSFSAPTNTAYVVAYFRNTEKAAGTFAFKNPILNIGNTAKPFKPREDSMLALQTELHANPDTGANPDSVFELDGQYFKLAKWRKVVLDGNLGWAVALSPSGFKQIEMNSYNFPLTGNQGYTTKYNGTVLPNFSGIPASADLGTISQATGRYYVTIANADSGWGDSYTPTLEEIKAYFMGWKMYDVNTNPDGSGVYNRTDGVGKWFVPVDRSSGGVNALPTTKVLTVAPYQLLYQLATPTVEPITSEGQLTFIEGDNQVEVGTGIVLRERAKPTTVGLNYLINHVDVPAGWLRYKTNRIMAVYKNNQLTDAVKVSNSATGQGGAFAYITPALFDPSISYSATYLILDKYPTANFDGTYAENEKAVLLDTVKSIQENTSRISVLESKKAEKDSPAWITPTLLNGWVTFGPSFPTAQFYKDSMDVVHLRGFIKSGLVSALLFNLPKGYRPGVASAMPVASATDATGAGLSSGTLNIQPDGQVQTAVNIKNGFLTLEGISFLAEQ